MKDFNDNFGLFILIYIVMICGSIISEEINKGTIKYLLTKPYTRSKILTSKILTIFILIPLIIIGMMLIELILGGLMLGFDSLKVPVIFFNENATSIVSCNLIKYSLLNILSISPMYIILIVLCFSLSTITASTSASITITFLFYLASNVIRNFVLSYNIKFLN